MCYFWMSHHPLSLCYVKTVDRQNTYSIAAHGFFSLQLLRISIEFGFLFSLKLCRCAFFFQVYLSLYRNVVLTFVNCTPSLPQNKNKNTMGKNFTVSRELKLFIIAYASTCTDNIHNCTYGRSLNKKL